MKQPQNHRGNRASFTKPTDLTQAKAWRTQLVEEVNDINAQLSDKNKADRCTACNGHGCGSCHGGLVRWSSFRYHQWRQSAITALRARESTLRKLNAWIDANTDASKPKSPADERDHARAEELLKQAYELLSTLKADLGGDFDEDEDALLVTIEGYLQKASSDARAAG